MDCRWIKEQGHQANHVTLTYGPYAQIIIEECILHTYKNCYNNCGVRINYTIKLIKKIKTVSKAGPISATGQTME